MTLMRLCMCSFIRMSSIIEELLPFDCLNFNELFCSQPQLSKHWIEFYETFTKYILSFCISSLVRMSLV